MAWLSGQCGALAWLSGQCGVSARSNGQCGATVLNVVPDNVYITFLCHVSCFHYKVCNDSQCHEK